MIAFRCPYGRRVVALMTAVIGLCQILTLAGPAGKLKI